MCNQLKVTFFKFRGFWIFYLAVLCVAGFSFWNGFAKAAPLGCNAYEMFSGASCDTSLIIILAVATSWFLGNDFSNRTIHHEISLGYSRLSVLLVRELPVMIFGVIFHSLFVFFAVLGVVCKNGFTGDLFKVQDIFWSLTVMLQIIALQSIITMITFICGKATSAIAASFCFIFITCNVLRNFLYDTFFEKTVFCFARNNASETLITSSIVAVITLVVVIVLTYLVFRKKEIK